MENSKDREIFVFDRGVTSPKSTLSLLLPKDMINYVTIHTKSSTGEILYLSSSNPTPEIKVYKTKNLMDPLLHPAMYRPLELDLKTGKGEIILEQGNIYILYVIGKASN